MRRRCPRWFAAVIILGGTVIAATPGAATTHTTVLCTCPAVGPLGNLSSADGVGVSLPVTINKSTGKYHGTVHAKVNNAFGHNVTFPNSGFNFQLPGITKSKYTVKVNGAATLTVQGDATKL